ncbi:MAG: hypothetical protein AAB511_03295 [Patescibacteria group bacterium]
MNTPNDMETDPQLLERVFRRMPRRLATRMRKAFCSQSVPLPTLAIARTYGIDEILCHSSVGETTLWTFLTDLKAEGASWPEAEAVFTELYHKSVS